MNKLQKHRKIAIELWLRKANTDIPTQVDYQLDSLLRKLFKLPARPENALPYERWMVGGKQDKSEEMRTSAVGINLIKRWEGFRSKAYLCPANVWTIGYGHTKTAKQGQVISELQAKSLLIRDLAEYEQAVNEMVIVPLTQNQFDALVSFTFNVGTGAFSRSTLLKVLNRGEYEKVASQFGRWVNGGGRKLPGLVNRRKEERKLFLTA